MEEQENYYVPKAAEITVLDTGPTDLCEFYGVMSKKAVPHRDNEPIEYILRPEQFTEIQIFASEYFEKPANKEYFIEKVKQYLCMDSSVSLKKGCEAAYNDTADFLITADETLFSENFKDPLRCDNVKEQYRKLAEKLVENYFTKAEHPIKFEKTVINISFNWIVKIENEANIIYKELASCKWKKPDIEVFKALFLEKAYLYLMESLDCNEAIT